MRFIVRQAVLNARRKTFPARKVPDARTGGEARQGVLAMLAQPLPATWRAPAIRTRGALAIGRYRQTAAPDGAAGQCAPRRRHAPIQPACPGYRPPVRQSR